MIKLPILSVLRLNNMFGRFIIRDEKNRNWTGKRLTDKSPPILYSDAGEACRDTHKILRSHFPKAMKPRTYVVPVFIEVYSEEPLSEGEIAEFLAKSQLQMDIDKNGNGPGDKSLVMPTIDWKRIEPIEEIPADIVEASE